MKKFKDFLVESNFAVHNDPLTDIGDNGLTNPTFLDNLNKELDIMSDKSYENAGQAFIKIMAVLAKYSVYIQDDAMTLSVIVAEPLAGEHILPVKANGNVEGYSLYFAYSKEEGNYMDIYAEVTNDEGLGEIMSVDPDDEDAEG